ncbi:MAG: hypothetical protein ACJ8R9_17255 [Steroidobacteraceae bacterium]
MALVELGNTIIDEERFVLRVQLNVVLVDRTRPNANEPKQLTNNSKSRCC